MAVNRGKQFEDKFKHDWLLTVPGSMCYRLYDTTSGYKAISNVGDFICYKYPFVYLIDCKSTQGNTLSFNDIRQFEKMCEYYPIEGVKVGVMWWSIKNDKVVWIPINTLIQLKKDNKKSFNIKMLNDDTYYALEIPSYKKRVFMDSDYSYLIENSSKGDF